MTADVKIPLLEKFRLNRLRNVVIYISSIILILALFFPVQGINNFIVQSVSFYFLIYGIYLWILDALFNRNNWISLIILTIGRIIGILITLKISFNFNLFDLLPK